MDDQSQIAANVCDTRIKTLITYLFVKLFGANAKSKHKIIALMTWIDLGMATLGVTAIPGEAMDTQEVTVVTATRAGVQINTATREHPTDTPAMATRTAAPLS